LNIQAAVKSIRNGIDFRFAEANLDLISVDLEFHPRFFGIGLRYVKGPAEKNSVIAVFHSQFGANQPQFREPDGENTRAQMNQVNLVFSGATVPAILD